jgi:hypothetical protein
MMKFTFALFSVLLSINTLAQRVDSVKRDSSLHLRLGHDISSSVTRQRFLTIIDNKLYYKKRIKKRWIGDLKNIVYVNVLKGPESRAKYGKIGNNGAVVIVRKQYAIVQYQKKLSPFSKEYKRYIESHQNHSDLIYLLNGVVLPTGEVNKQLYDIPAASIKSVDVMDKYYRDVFNNDKPIIVITTN